MPITPTNIKLICSDIDGTLLQYGKKTLEAEILSQIKALSARGILFCPASGRQYTSLRLLFEPVADCCVFLCENGGVLFKDEQCIAENPMPRALAEEIARDMWQNSDGQGEVMLSGQNCAYLMERGLGMLDRIRFIGNRYKVIADPSEIPEEIVKVSVYLHEGVAPYVDRFVPRWQQANCAVAGPYWIDTTTANKGVGVQSLCRVLGIAPDEVMAFGDNFNDVSMLDIVDTPYIMDSAAPALPPLVQEAMEDIRANYVGLYGVEELSERLGVSKSHLVRTFTAALGIPPGRYLTKVRVEAAMRLLLHREYTLDVIASLCGFSGANYLCRVFKKETGHSPAQWRAMAGQSLRPGLSPEESQREQELYI